MAWCSNRLRLVSFEEAAAYSDAGTFGNEVGKYLSIEAAGGSGDEILQGHSWCRMKGNY